MENRWQGKPGGRLVLVASAIALAAALVLLRREREPEPAGAAVRPGMPPATGKDPDPARAEIASRPFSGEDPSAPAPAGGAPGVEIVVLDPEGVPAEGVHVLVFQWSLVLANGRTGADGILRARAWTDAATVAVFSVGRPYHLERGRTAEARMLVRLPAGQILDGFLTVDGVTPAEPVRLVLREWSPITGVFPEVLQKDLPLVWEGGVAEAMTDAGGAFRFEGIAAAWQGQLALPERLVLRNRADRISMVFLELPESGLRVDAISLPEIRGRVVRPSGEPVPHARYLWKVEGGFDLATEGDTDAEGRFRFLVRSRNPARASLVVGSPANAGARTIELDAAQLRGCDLGDVALEACRLVSLTVRDSEGRPIAGGTAHASGLTGPLAPDASPLTEELGRARLECGAGIDRLQIGARGYESVGLDVPRGPNPEIDAVLPRAAALDVSVLLDDGAPAPGTVVRISADEELLIPAAAREAEPALPASDGGSPVPSARRGCLWEPDAKGSVRVWGVRPEVPLRIEALGAPGVLLAEARVAAGKSADTPVRLVVLQRSRVLVGQVVDAKAEPVFATLRYANAIGGENTATAHGPVGFKIEHLYAPALPLKITCLEHARLSEAAFEVPEDGREVRIVLGGGVDCEVALVDVEGRPVNGIPYIECNGVAMGFSRRNEERWQFRNVLPGRVTAKVRWAIGSSPWKAKCRAPS